MDIDILTTQAITLLQSFLIKGAEEIPKSMAKDLWQKFKGLFKSQQEKKLLKEFQENPDDKVIIDEVKTVIESELKSNEKVYNDFLESMRQLQKKVTQKSNIQLSGNNNIVVNNVYNSKINFNKK